MKLNFFTPPKGVLQIYFIILHMQFYSIELKIRLYMERNVSVERLKQGNEEELRLFYNKYFSLFVSFADQLLPPNEDGKDVVHDVFVNYWEKREQLKDLISIQAFFYKSIRNRCLNVLRHRKVHDQYTEEYLRRANDVEFLHDTILKKEAFFIIYEEISRLTGTEQRVMQLVLDGMSNDEIATELGMAVATVKTHKAKSYAALRKRLKEVMVLLFVLDFEVDY